MLRRIAQVAAVIALTGFTSYHVSGQPVSRVEKPADPRRASGTGNILVRRYLDGDRLTYEMKGVNQDWRYEIQGDGVVIPGPTAGMC